MVDLMRLDPGFEPEAVWPIFTNILSKSVPVQSLPRAREETTLTWTYREMKDARSCRVSPNTPVALPLSKLGFFFCVPFHKQGSYAMYIIFWPGGLLTFYDPFLIKVDQPENLFSLEVFFLYISNLCQPQKVLNRVTFSWSKGAVGHNKERTY